MSEMNDFFEHLEHTLGTLPSDDLSNEDRILKVHALVGQLFVLACADEPLHFTTLFARISHVCNKKNIPTTLTRDIQRFRITAEGLQRKGLVDDNAASTDIWVTGAYAVHEVASLLLGIPASVPTAELIGRPRPHQVTAMPMRTGFKRYARLVAHDIDREADVLWVTDADSDGTRIALRFADAGRSELFKDNILQACEIFGFPFSLSAIDVEVDSAGGYSPRILVIEPDYLIDISLIAECYQQSGGDVRLYIPKKFQESRSNPSLLIGKIVNYFLDEMIHDPDVTFNTLFPRTFFLNPIEFATLSDDEVLFMMKDCEVHFNNLQRAVHEDFPDLGLEREHMSIEPAFYCPVFGIQGRLDLFQKKGNDNHIYIIELKSGQAFMANAYGLSSSHYAQTLLYDLMIKAVYDFRPRQTCYVLYSRYHEKTMRFAPPVEAIQREVIRLRNDMLLVEGALGKQAADQPGWFERIHPDAFPEMTGFMLRDITAFSDTWQQLDNLEKRYVRIFTRFIANEHFLAKVGMHGSDQVHGLAGLWLETDSEKEERFTIYADLKIESIHIDDSEFQKDAYLHLINNSPTEALVNFRVGDIAVLYPKLNNPPDILKTQIYKCTVTSLAKDEIIVRLRSRQVSYDDLLRFERWSLEHDLYDRSFQAMHAALFTFAGYEKDRRALFLGRIPPPVPQDHTDSGAAHLPQTQKDILDKIIAANGYFLLWGPPGTGKTRIILHHLVKYYLTKTPEQIVLLAYTNRAVDEICQSLDAIGGDIRGKYVRIGSHVGTGREYLDQLLNNKIKGMRSRKEVTALLGSQRILVGTIASFSGKPELLKLFRTDLVIVDEASQVLEPMLSGILPSFRKWVLIGDHRQLPAVVVQPPEHTTLGNEAIAEIALEDTRDSYFERMFCLCQRNGWDWAYGILTHQGRMHREIMAFPDKMFYNTQLRLFDKSQWNGRDYTGKIPITGAPDDDPLSQALAAHRMIWLPSKPEPDIWNAKTHDDEAGLIIEVLTRLHTLYSPLPEIGILTPFRAQIANIRARMIGHSLDPDRITIDTVERYQGSARDIIILSLSIHRPSQLSNIVSLSREKIDRKLNVALTRAKEQFILIASEAAIQFNQTYLSLTKTCTRFDVSEIPAHRMREVPE